MNRRIIGFHQDDLYDWVADLDCGHTQHVRHQPPFINRSWVIDPNQREKKLGSILSCLKCSQQNKEN